MKTYKVKSANPNFNGEVASVPTSPKFENGVAEVPYDVAAALVARGAFTCEQYWTDYFFKEKMARVRAAKSQGESDEVGKDEESE